MESTKQEFHKGHYRCPSGEHEANTLSVPKKYSTDSGYGYCWRCQWWFNPPTASALARAPKVPQTAPDGQLRYVEQDIVRRSCDPSHYAGNALFQFLSGVFGEPATRAVFSRYHVGTAKGGKTVFWTVDGTGFRSAKVFAYCPNTGKRKREGTNVCYEQFRSADGYRPCVFGLHLLCNAELEAVMVHESEKAAIVACLGGIFGEGVVHLASSGAGGLTRAKCVELAQCRGGDRKIHLIPDHDTPGEQGFGTAAERLNGWGTNAEVRTLASLFPTCAVGKGDDVADVVLHALMI